MDEQQQVMVKEELQEADVGVGVGVEQGQGQGQGRGDPDFDGLEALANAAENGSEEASDDPVVGGGTSTPNTVDDEEGQAEDTEFMREYKKWYKKHQQEDYKAPKFNKRDFSIERLWNVVRMYGGSQQVCREKAWAKIGRQFNPPKSMTNLSFHIKRLYERYLLAYEKEATPNNAMPWQHSPYQKRYREENESSGESPNKRVYKGYISEKWVHQSAVPLRGRQLAGRRIKLWIPQEKDYMQANVLTYNEQKDVYGLEYDDGFQEEVDLNLETWYLSSSEAEGLAVQQFQKLINIKGGNQVTPPRPSLLNNTSNLFSGLGTEEAATNLIPNVAQPLLEQQLEFPMSEGGAKMELSALNLPLDTSVVDNVQASIDINTQLLMQTLLNWKDLESSVQQRTLLDFALKLGDAQRKIDTLDIEMKSKDILLRETKERGQQDKSELIEKIEKLEFELQEARRSQHTAEAGQIELRNCFQMLLQTVLNSGNNNNNSNNNSASNPTLTNSGVQQHSRQMMGSLLSANTGGSGGFNPPQTAPLIRALMQVANFSNLPKPQAASPKIQPTLKKAATGSLSVGLSPSITEDSEAIRNEKK
eukprot:TRINITY_DN1706_c0_g1_i1.p1 TRINITY_DN1706_c0_g1~~TRINITY_DN1706_c0_g1_i1.p1  ORF type:complete len:589 (+),score=105.26 TRINITY_DN1706_c0_g1_i1:241-2007(+)